MSFVSDCCALGFKAPWLDIVQAEVVMCAKYSWSFMPMVESNMSISSLIGKYNDSLVVEEPTEGQRG